MKIIKNVLYIVSLLCISNVFAMQNNIPAALYPDREALYIFKDGCFCSVFYAFNRFNFVFGEVSRQYKVYGSHIIGPSFQKCTRMDLRVKNYQEEDVIFFQEGRYPAHVARTLLNTEEILQIVEKNRKKEKDTEIIPEKDIEKVEKSKNKEKDTTVTPEAGIEKKVEENKTKEKDINVTPEKDKEEAEENRKKEKDTTVTPETVVKKIKIILSNNKNFLFTGVVVGSTLAYISYSLYKKYKAKQNKADDLVKADDETEEENDTLLLAELNE